jgi:chemotaxis protein MotB
MKQLLAGISIVALAVTTTGCVTTQRYRDALEANKALQRELEDLENAYAALEAQRDELANLYDRAAASAKDAAWLDQRTAELEELLGRMRRDTVDIEGVAVRSTSEGTVFDVEGEVLFQSGQAALTEQGVQTLRQLAPVLARDRRPLRIQGHTDTDPIRRSQWRSNLHLSAARALAVAESLIAAGVPAESISVAGYGEHEPRPDNPGTDEKSRKRWNRRVEILLVGS